MLDLALARQPHEGRETPFEQSLRAFEDAVAASPAGGVERCARWAQELGIALPCTIQDLKRAFRRLAFETHPDRPGGSHEAFLRAQALLGEALASLRSTAGGEGAVRSYGRYGSGGARATHAQSIYA